MTRVYVTIKLFKYTAKGDLALLTFSIFKSIGQYALCSFIFKKVISHDTPHFVASCSTGEQKRGPKMHIFSQLAILGLSLNLLLTFKGCDTTKDQRGEQGLAGNIYTSIKLVEEGRNREKKFPLHCTSIRLSYGWVTFI